MNRQQAGFYQESSCVPRTRGDEPAFIAGRVG